MKLILNADDFGISRGVNYAIQDCYGYGMLTSASLMTNMEHVNHAVRLMRSMQNFSVGLHLTLTVGKPLSGKKKTLTNESGYFTKDILLHPEKASATEIQTELKAQWDRFTQLTGHVPDHINSHHCIEVLPAAKEFMQVYSRTYRVPVRHFLPQVEMAADIPTTKPWLTPKTDSNALGCLKDYFDADKMNSEDTYEIFLHPGYVDDDLCAVSSYTLGRCKDAAVFLSEDLKRWILENSIELVDFRSIHF